MAQVIADPYRVRVHLWYTSKLDLKDLCRLAPATTEGEIAASWNYA